MTVPTTIDAGAWLEQVPRGRRRRPRPGPGHAGRLRRGADARPGLDAVRRRLRRAHRGAGELAQRLSDAALGHPGRHDRPGRAQAPPWGLLPRVPAPAAAAGRTGPGGGGLPGLRRGGVHPPGRRPGQGHGHRGDLQVRGVADGRRARRQGGRVQGAPLGPGPLSLPVDRRPHPAGARGRPGGERLGGHRHRRQRRGAAGRSSASTSSPPRTPPPGRPSCAPWWPGGCAGWSWSSPTPTAASRPPSPRCSPRPPGSGAAPTSWPTWPPGSPRPPGR